MGTIVEDSGGVNMQPAGRSGNQAASVAFAFIQETLGLEDKGVGEGQIRGHGDPILALLLEANQGVKLGLLFVRRLHSLRDGERDARGHPRTRLRQRGPLDLVSGCFLRPPSPGGNRNVVPIAHLAEPSAGEAQFLGEGVQWLSSRRGRLEAVVQTDGTVGEVRVKRSLDRQFGLDDEAVATVKKWKFTAGTKDGVAVPALVEIEMTFSLKK